MDGNVEACVFRGCVYCALQTSASIGITLRLLVIQCLSWQQRVGGHPKAGRGGVFEVEAAFFSARDDRGLLPTHEFVRPAVDRGG